MFRPFIAQLPADAGERLVLFLVAALAVSTLVIVSRAVLVVPQSHAVVLERFGRFRRTLGTGIGLRIPLLESVRRVDDWGAVANKRGFQVELTEQQTDTGPKQAQTRDNVTLVADAVVYWRIVAPRRALYDVDVLPRSVGDVALNALRTAIGRRELDEVTSERRALGEEVMAELRPTADTWGIEFTRVDIQEVTYDTETSAAMRQQMEAERRRRATISEAQGTAEGERTLAAAERDALLARAEGQAGALRSIAAADAEYLTQLGGVVGPDRAAELLLAQKTLQGYERITQNPANKVFLPNGTQGLSFFGDGAEPAPAVNGAVRPAEDLG